MRNYLTNYIFREDFHAGIGIPMIILKNKLLMTQSDVKYKDSAMQKAEIRRWNVEYNYRDQQI